MERGQYVTAIVPVHAQSGVATFSDSWHFSEARIVVMERDTAFLPDSVDYFDETS